MKVSILNDRGKIRLKYRYQNKYEYISLGLNYNKENLKIASAKAEQIRSDIIFNRYEGKENYQINPRKKETWDLLHILEYYLTAKKHDNTVYIAGNILKQWFSRSPKKLLFVEKLDEWVLYLKRYIPRLDDKGVGYADSTISLNLKTLRAAVYFAYEMGKIPQPKTLAKVCKLVKPKQKKEVKVYNREEIKLIISSFRDNPNHSYYTDLVQFRFLTGCRPSEAIALTWDDIVYREGKTFIRFNKRYSKGELKAGLKNRKPVRYFPCNNQLTIFLNQLPHRHPLLIFPSVKGGYLKVDNFVKRHWNIVVNGLIALGKLKFKISFYDERHCFGTLICREVNDLRTVATIMGNSPSVLEKHYLANDETLILPEIFNE